MIIGKDPVNKVAFVLSGYEEYAINELEGDKNKWQIVVLKEIPKALYDRRGINRPLISGISIGNDSGGAGTLGWFINIGGQEYILTNAHVVVDEPHRTNYSKDYPIYQPALMDGGTISNEVATYERHIPIVFDGQSECPITKTTIKIFNTLAKILRRQSRIYSIVQGQNYIDAGIAKVKRIHKVKREILYNNKLVKPKYIHGLLFAGTGDVYIMSKMSNIKQYFPGDYGAEIKELNVGDRVWKCGRTSGCTDGIVISTNAEIKVSYGEGKIATFKDVVVVKGENQPGDSGSLVFTPYGAVDHEPEPI